MQAAHGYDKPQKIYGFLLLLNHVVARGKWGLNRSSIWYIYNIYIIYIYYIYCYHYLYYYYYCYDYYYEIWGGKLLDIYLKMAIGVNPISWSYQLPHIAATCVDPISSTRGWGGCCHGRTLPRAFIGKAPDGKTMSNSPAPVLFGFHQNTMLRNLGVKLGQLGKKQWVKSYELPYFVGLFHGYNIHSEHPFTSCWKISHQGCLHLRQRTIQQISCCGSAMSGMDFVYGEDRMGKAMGKAGDLEFNDF